MVVSVHWQLNSLVSYRATRANMTTFWNMGTWN